MGAGGCREVQGDAEGSGGAGGVGGVGLWGCVVCVRGCEGCEGVQGVTFAPFQLFRFVFLSLWRGHLSILYLIISVYFKDF